MEDIFKQVLVGVVIAAIAGVWAFGASMFEFEGTDYSEKFSKWWMGKFKSSNTWWIFHAFTTKRNL